MYTYSEYIVSGEAELFTVVCLPDAEGKYPTVIYRTPYVNEEENMSEAYNKGVFVMDYLQSVGLDT